MTSMNRTMGTISFSSMVAICMSVSVSAQAETEPQEGVTMTYETLGVDLGADGTVDFLETTTVFYDANGDELSRSHTRAKCDNGVGNGPDCRPGMARFNNDDVGGVPGDPGARDKITYETFGVDLGADGTVEYLETTTAVYDVDGNLLSSHTRAKCDNGVGNGPDCRPGMARFNNDDVGGVPGDPGAAGGAGAGT